MDTFLEVAAKVSDKPVTENPYAGIDNRSKVRHLQEGTKTSALASIKNTILASSTLRCDFTTCVGLYKDFILQTTTSDSNQSLIIASVETRGRGRG